MFQTLGLILQVFLLDLVLSGDNAVVIALACRSLPSAQVSQAMMIGTGAAIGLRVLLTTLTSWLLLVPLLKLVGGVWLIVIAIRLLVAQEEEEEQGLSTDRDDPSRLWEAVTTILAADLVMSLDNVVALAAVSQGRTLYLVLGLLMSVPLLMFGSRLLTYMLQRYPILVPAGGALLGYVAGSIAMTDPVIADAINAQSPALTVIVPLLCAVYVVLQSRIIEHRRLQIPVPVRPRIERRPAPVHVVAANALAHVDVLQVASDVSTRGNEVLAAPQPERSSMPEEAPGADAGLRLVGIPRVVLFIAVGLSLTMAALYAILDSPDIGTGNAGTTPNVSEDARFVCPGSDVTIFYRHGANAIRLVSAEGQVTGYVDHQNVITWENTQISSRLPFTLPDKIEGYAKKIILYGGSFSRDQCELQN